MGGIALGKGVSSSGLLETMDEVIRDMMAGFSLVKVVFILSPIVLVRATPSIIISCDTYRLSTGYLHLYQPHYCQCSSRPNRERSRQKSAG